VEAVSVLGGSRRRVRFVDGTSGIVDLGSFLASPATRRALTSNTLKVILRP
jgi:hypothetical protein